MHMCVCAGGCAWPCGCACLCAGKWGHRILLELSQEHFLWGHQLNQTVWPAGPRNPLVFPRLGKQEWATRCFYVGSRDETQAFRFVGQEFYELIELSGAKNTFLNIYSNATLTVIAIRVKAWAETVARRQSTACVRTQSPALGKVKPWEETRLDREDNYFIALICENVKGKNSPL